MAALYSVDGQIAASQDEDAALSPEPCAGLEQKTFGKIT
jgi:hypothetical protein